MFYLGVNLNVSNTVNAEFDNYMKTKLFFPARTIEHAINYKVRMLVDTMIFGMEFIFQRMWGVGKEQIINALLSIFIIIS